MSRGNDACAPDAGVELDKVTGMGFLDEAGLTDHPDGLPRFHVINMQWDDGDGPVPEFMYGSRKMLEVVHSVSAGRSAGAKKLGSKI